MKQTPYERMMAGKLFVGFDEGLLKLQDEGWAKKAAYDAIDPADSDARKAALEGLFGSTSERIMVSDPFYIEYGSHIHLGNCFINMGATFLDSNTITIGDMTLVGPHVQFLTSSHPANPDERIPIRDEDGNTPDGYEGGTYALPIKIGDKCWIGAGSIIMGGVTIGDGTTIGAGSIVTKDIPARCVAFGSPARVMRYFDEE